MSAEGHTTQFGFVWGAAVVTRVLERRGGVLMNVATKRGSVDLFVTPTGLIRVNVLKPVKKVKASK